jgi:hypothetical protein
MKTDQPRQLRISLAILYLPVVLFLIAARSVIIALTGNVNFTTPFPALAEITAALDDLEAKIAAAAGRDKTAVAVRNTAWETAKTLIRQLTNYVQMHCQNDLGILLSSGFTATKIPTPVGPVGAPQNPRLTRTEMTGEVLFRFSAVYGTTAGYLVQIATDSEGPFTDYVNTSSTRVLIDGRTPFAKVWARVRATGTAGPGPWSEPTCVMVL